MNNKPSDIFEQYHLFLNNSFKNNFKYFQQFLKKSSKLNGFSSEENQQYTDYMYQLYPTINNLNTSFINWVGSLLNNQDTLIDHQDTLISEIHRLNEYYLGRLKGGDPEPLTSKEERDRRFKDEDWHENPTFEFIRKFYVIMSTWMNQLVELNEGVDKKSRDTVRFYVKQVLSAMSPSNFIATNPEVLKATISERGENLLQGFENLKKDISFAPKFDYKMKHSDDNYFKLGENIAQTNGRVVFKNEVVELIQYTPLTEEVFKVPVLVIPPFINKYYILDINEQKSLVRWMVSKGMTVFCISWVNPDKAYAEYNFEDYMYKGVVESLKTIEKQTGEYSIHAVGYCIGGTLLSCAMAYLNAIGEGERVINATFLATLINFDSLGELGIFIDENQISAIEHKMSKQGYFDGRDMANVFNSLKPDDLFWWYVVNNYLLGKTPQPFDVLHWNSDATRLPAKLHSYYLRNLCLKNLLVIPGALEMMGKPIDLSTIQNDVFCVATTDDHIVPWETAYKIKSAFKSKNVEFVLSTSGHIMGIIQGENGRDSSYWTNKKNYNDVRLWKQFSKREVGSWWKYWAKWLQPRLGCKVPARDPHKGKLKSICSAPGEYVLVR